MAAINNDTDYPVTVPVATDTFVASHGSAGIAATFQVQIGAMFTAMVGANYASLQYGLTVTNALSTTKQVVNVDGVASALKLSTTAVQSTGALVAVNLQTDSINCPQFFVDGTGVCFNGGSAGVAKGTITGSRGGNAALASLLTYLALRGDITNSTSA